MRWRAAALSALLTIGCREEAGPIQPSTDKPQVALLTSLPLAFGEGFTLDAAPHPVLKRLEQEFTVALVDGPEQLPAGGTLLAAQPQALTAERLVGLDKWVRDGGRLLLLADPQLSWESERPLGDRLRPPFAFPDTGLLAHWGLRLNSPDESGPAMRQLGGAEVLTRSPGRLTVEDGSNCTVAADGLVARCAISKGRAVVVADADFIQVGRPGGQDGSTDRNLDALAAELSALAR